MKFDIFILLQHKLKLSQRDKVKKFITFTQTGEQTAIYCLAQNDWKLDLASDNYFQNPEAYYKEPKNSVDKKKLEILFSRYQGNSIKKHLSMYNYMYIVINILLIFILDSMVKADPNEPDKITADGIMKFLDDLSLSPESKLVLIIAWKFRAETQCEFTKDEFMNGMMDLG